MDIASRLSLLFGTEEHVRMRRQLVLFREEVMNFLVPLGVPTAVPLEDYRFICSGSLCEGVHYPSSDDDFMLCKNTQLVVKTYIEALQSGCLLMVPSENSPGYCLLFDINHSCSENVIQVINGMPFLSSLLFKEVNLLEGQSIHGPCQSRTIGGYEYDFAKCFRCSFWPDIATSWAIRTRHNGWPSLDMIQKILRDGCHVVPVGDPNSLFRDHEWRISFSIAERNLMYSLNHTQFLMYNLLRLCLKKILNIRVPGVLCSYFMKTTLFFTVENTSEQLWQFDNIETCFKSCLSVLYDYIDQGNCSNYFIPEYNMMKRKVNSRNRQPLLDIIGILRALGIIGTIHICKEEYILDENIPFRGMELKLDDDFMKSNHTAFAINRITMISYFLSKTVNIPITTLLCKISRLSCRHLTGVQNYIFRRGIVSCCQIVMNNLWSGNESNRNNYFLHKSVKCLLRIGYSVDVITGKLTAATYMYLVGKNKSALSHIRRLLSEYPPYAIDNSPNDIKQSTNMVVMCSRGYTMDYKIRHSWALRYYMCHELLNAYPLALQILISTTEKLLLNPLSYTYLLESLCYIQQQNQNGVKKSTRCLVSLMEDPNHEEKLMTEVNMCVGIIKYAQGDSQSACRWLGSAYTMKDKLLPPYNESLGRSSVTYIACLLNKHFYS
ncbi:hypothetical protein FSP39_018751 [Pinctada imbricata]|uniref:Cyclic GMP-AMP synthase n=1 Tax=Pinctada imbricata TaxID=66713 RepID=A0AA88XDP3_PINIB|nr:hypothetical protein FSP39_018751 [Pinctada imbricata]